MAPADDFAHIVRREASMAKSFEQRGGCHCGALRYTVAMPPRWMHACHCTDCQRHTGSAFGLVVAVPEARFHLIGTPKLVQRVLGSGKVRQRWICPACGTWICDDPVVVDGDDMRYIRGGTFDDTSWVVPHIHFWIRSKQPWLVLPDDATAHPTQPGHSGH
jgi:hypothetical protein